MEDKIKLDQIVKIRILKYADKKALEGNKPFEIIESEEKDNANDKCG